MIGIYVIRTIINILQIGRQIQQYQDFGQDFWATQEPKVADGNFTRTGTELNLHLPDSAWCSTLSPDIKQ
jgi:hypothetical protein